VSREHIAEADGDAGEELLKRFVLKHKSHCRGKLMVAQHLDGADWFAYAYACTICGSAVGTRDPRYKSRGKTSHVTVVHSRRSRAP
jgi:hypothetical protein